ncbi:unnamed protein product [Mytilus coruscus]|uniref:Reverse transcriptase domain-containing protein n=1 Tax=Mytilus coruscus TaxID=42192 RepID=A0A6J8BVL5_MYTCO|nr:unnamed protein product [Mytilus coruscus]
MIMNEVVRDLNWKSTLVYVDDILIYSKNFEEHLCHLAALFHKLIEVNLKLKPSKCQFACKEVQYLGHIITKEGIAVDPEKTASVHSFAAPKNVKEVRMYIYPQRDLHKTLDVLHCTETIIKKKKIRCQVIPESKGIYTESNTHDNEDTSRVNFSTTTYEDMDCTNHKRATTTSNQTHDIDESIAPVYDDIHEIQKP